MGERAEAALTTAPERPAHLAEGPRETAVPQRRHEGRGGGDSLDRTQFTFYDSFFRALARIRKKQDRADAYDAICAYALYGAEPELDRLPDSAAIAFSLIKPNLDASRRKADSGKRGGAVRRGGSGLEANEKGEQTVRKRENKREKENETENNCSLPAPLPEGLPPAPAFAEVLAEAQRAGCPEIARPFFDYYAAAGWRDGGGRPVRSWRQKLAAWKAREDRRQRGVPPAAAPGKSWAELAEEGGT